MGTYTSHWFTWIPNFLPCKNLKSLANISIQSSLLFYIKIRYCAISGFPAWDLFSPAVLQEQSRKYWLNTNAYHAFSFLDFFFCKISCTSFLFSFPLHNYSLLSVGQSHKCNIKESTLTPSNQCKTPKVLFVWEKSHKNETVQVKTLHKNPVVIGGQKVHEQGHHHLAGNL